MPTEIVIAIVGLLASVGAAIVASRGQARVTAEGLYKELCKSQQERIAQLVTQIEGNEREIRELQTQVIAAQTRIAQLEGESQRKDARIMEQGQRIKALEAENVTLREEIDKLRQQRRRPTKTP